MYLDKVGTGEHLRPEISPRLAVLESILPLESRRTGRKLPNI